MNLEEFVFQHQKAIPERLLAYGFQPTREGYDLKCHLLSDQFEVRLSININGQVSGKLYDCETGEAYVNLHTPQAQGPFVTMVREAYLELLEEIARQCFVYQPFLFEQTQRMSQWIEAHYGDKPEFLWQNDDHHAVWRHRQTGKWYAIMIQVEASKLQLSRSGLIEIINVKIDPQKRDLYLQQKGCKLCYHMNKKHWLSLIMDDSLSDQSIQSLLSESYVLTAPRKKVA